MVLSGRMKANQTIGTGKLEVFNDLKKNIGNDEGSSHISMFSEKKSKKQERGLVENDEAFKAYETMNEREEAKEKKKDKKKKKHDKLEK